MVARSEAAVTEARKAQWLQMTTTCPLHVDQQQWGQSQLQVALMLALMLVIQVIIAVLEVRTF